MIELLKPGDLIRMVIRTTWRNGFATLRVSRVYCDGRGLNYVGVVDVSSPHKTTLYYHEQDLVERKATVLLGRKCPKRKERAT